MLPDKKFDLTKNWPTPNVYKEIAYLANQADDLQLINQRTHSLVWQSQQKQIVINVRQIRVRLEQVKNNLKATKLLAELGLDVLVPSSYSIIDKTLITISQLGRQINAQEMDWSWLGQTLYKLHNLSIKIPSLKKHDPVSAIKKYLFQISQNELDDPLPPLAEIQNICYQRIKNWQQAVEQFQPQTSLVHADPHPGNIILINNRLKLIDLESLGVGVSLYDLAVVWDMRHFGFKRAFLKEVFRAYGYNPLQDPAWQAISEIRTIRGALSNYATAVTLPTEAISSKKRQLAALRLEQALLGPKKRDPNCIFTDTNNVIAFSRD